MPAARERPPAFELDVAARAKHIRFLVPGRNHTHSEGVAPVSYIGQRHGLPDRVRQGVRSTDVHATYRIAAWLADAGAAGESRPASGLGAAASARRCRRRSQKSSLPQNLGQPGLRTRDARDQAVGAGAPVFRVRGRVTVPQASNANDDASVPEISDAVGAGSSSRTGSKAMSHDRRNPGMKKASNVAIAIGVGYLLGRKHKLRLALILATTTATGRLPGAASQAIKRGGSLLGSSDAVGKLSPDLGKVMSTVRGDLAGAGKAAVQAAVASRIESLTDSLHERTEGLRNPPEPDEPEEEEAEEAEVEEPDRGRRGERPPGRGRGESRSSARRDSARPRRREQDDRGSDRPRRRREPESRESERPARRPRSDSASVSPSARRRGK